MNPKGLKGSGRFFEYRTDDARLTLEVLKPANKLGATSLNYTEHTSTYSDKMKLNGAVLEDKQSGKKIQIKARCIINATGPLSGQIIQQN